MLSLEAQMHTTWVVSKMLSLEFIVQAGSTPTCIAMEEINMDPPQGQLYIRPQKSSKIHGKIYELMIKKRKSSKGTKHHEWEPGEKNINR